MTCSIEGCDKPIHNKQQGWCQMHYFRWWRTGDVGEPESRKGPRNEGPCSVADCDKPAKSTGLCSMHYARKFRHGDVHTVIAPDQRAVPRGPDHPNWLGDEISYYSAHTRILWSKGKASSYKCSFCEQQAYHWAYDHSDPNEKTDPILGMPYSPNPIHYMPLCVKCHKRFDLDRGQSPTPTLFGPPPGSPRDRYTPPGGMLDKEGRLS